MTSTHIPLDYKLPPLKLETSATMGLGKRQSDEMVTPSSDMVVDKSLDASPNPKKPKILFKGHDHEIVKARKKMSKGCSNTPPKSCNVVTDTQV